ncbi:MAG TPA: fluoride efflux transporter CrcB [Chiayiivirga sp.]|nr:fluoride efflux transporter CrcB [Chiayiivirga sp.]
MSGLAWWQQALVVALGGALGSVGRFAVSGWMARAAGSGFPWGTLAVNLLGSLAAGIALAWFQQRAGGSMAWRLFVMVGVLGGFTTWSALAVDTLLLGRGESPVWAATYVAASLFGGLLLVWIGWRSGLWMRG